MSIGTGIALFVAGAIVTWVINVNLPYVADYALGLVLMGAGVVCFVVAVIMYQQRRHHRVTEHEHHHEYPPGERPPYRY